ncbi:MAG: DNA-3-methyladenine glycosylase [Candidatus Pacearchaeota archaeon]
MKPLSKSFFKKSTIEIAKKLLGKLIINETSQGKIIGKIVETEAYLKDDPASHSFCGLTKRNSPMFEKPGTSYVYFTYGMYHCFNIVTNKKGIGEAVLIRAIEPIDGVKLMKKNRKIIDEKNLSNGPAKLTIALGIDKKLNGINLLDKNSPLKIMRNENEKIFNQKLKTSCSSNFKIIQTTRIGISKGKELPHRFYIKENKWVSKK